MLQGPTRRGLLNPFTHPSISFSINSVYLPIKRPMRAAGAVEAGSAEVAQALALDGGVALSRGEAVFVREYEGGRLARSEALTAEEVALIGAASKPPARSPSKRAKRKVQPAFRVSVVFFLSAVTHGSSRAGWRCWSALQTSQPRRWLSLGQLPSPPLAAPPNGQSVRCSLSLGYRGFSSSLR